MAFRHAMMRSHSTVTRIFGDVRRPDDALTAKGRTKDWRVPGHTELFKSLQGSSGKGIKQEWLPFFVRDIVKKRPKTGAAQLHGRIGYSLDDALEIQF